MSSLLRKHPQTFTRAATTASWLPARVQKFQVAARLCFLLSSGAGSCQQLPPAFQVVQRLLQPHGLGGADAGLELQLWRAAGRQERMPVLLSLCAAVPREGASGECDRNINTYGRRHCAEALIALCWTYQLQHLTAVEQRELLLC